MLSIMCLCFFFFKQKTAYEMRISDWSSDVCSSDLVTLRVEHDDIGEIAVAQVAATVELERVSGLAAATVDELGDRDRLLVQNVFRVLPREGEIGRASCRERVCQYV